MGIVAYLLRVESAIACGGSEMGPTDGGAMEAIGTAALTEAIPLLDQENHFISKYTVPQSCLDRFTCDLMKNS